MHALYILLLGPKMQALLHQKPICLRELQMETEPTSGSDFLIGVSQTWDTEAQSLDKQGSVHTLRYGNIFV